MAKIAPLSDQILLRPVAATTASGIVIPDSAAQNKPGEGEVLAVGPGARADDGSLRAVESVTVGQKVIFSRYAGTEIKIDGEDLILVREKDLLAVVK